MIPDDFSAEILGLLPEVFHHFRALYAILVAGIIIHICRRRQLTSRLIPLNNDRIQIGACGIDGGRIAGRAGTENDQTMMLGVRHG